MKKVLLLLFGVLSAAFSIKADNWMLAAESDFPITTPYSYALIHRDNLTFTTLPYQHTNWYDATVITVTRLANLVFGADQSTFETVGFEAQDDGTYKMYFKNATNNKYYFIGINDEGYIKTPSRSASSGAKVSVEFRYGDSGTVHYDGKELQLIDNKFVFAAPTDDTARKVCLYVKKSSYPSYGPSSVSINMYNSASLGSTYPKTLTIGNTAPTTFYIRSSNSNLNPKFRIVAEGEQPSADYVISNATGAAGEVSSLTINKDAAAGTYRFTGYYMYDYQYTSSPVTFTITILDNPELVWTYGPRYGSKTEINPDDTFEVEWTPEEVYFNVAVKSSTGQLTQVNPMLVTMTVTGSGVLNISSSSSSSPIARGYGFGWLTSPSGTFPREVTYTATSSLGEIPLKLNVLPMKPVFTLNYNGKSDFAWSKDGSYTVNFKSPNLDVVYPNKSGAYVQASLEPAADFADIPNTTLPDGNYMNTQRVTVDLSTTSKTAGTISISDIPCSGKYNLVLNYHRSNYNYVDQTYKSIIPLNIYPSAEGLQMGIVTHDGDGNPRPDNVIRIAAVSGGTWTGPQEYDNATAQTSIYRDVVLMSETVAGISGYYKAEAAPADTEAASYRISAPAGYDFTSALSGQYMNLFDVDKLSLYVAKNGAIAPSPIEITLSKTDQVVSGIDAVTGDTDTDATAEYYNLQGILIAEPVPGNLYIRRQGASAQKIVFSQSK